MLCVATVCLELVVEIRKTLSMSQLKRKAARRRSRQNRRMNLVIPNRSSQTLVHFQDHIVHLLLRKQIVVSAETSCPVRRIVRVIVIGKAMVERITKCAPEVET